uniref:RING-type domain-containing protein n=1 Tax=Globisporangium ultimum (strain ATCC 200006 / CBS 805.95 / DAOM BR144) TaxID=431595 RepID=K3WR97_GLOUD
MATTQVFLQCTKANGKLRVRITSPGYFNDANCQFPRNIRSEGQVYCVEPRCVRLVQTAGGKNFYRISQPIKLWDEDDSDAEAMQELERLDKNGDGGKTKRGKKRRNRPVEKPKAVYDHKDEPDCLVCFESPKEQIFVPCGHFCMCTSCIQQLVHPKKCPLCREPIKNTIHLDEL